MSFKLILGPLTADEVNRLMALLSQHGLAGTVTTGVGAAPAATMAGPPQGAPQGAVPAPPGGAPPAAPPAPPAPAAAPANPAVAKVLQLMDAYSRHGHGINGARAVLAHAGLQRVQDANPEQLAWLETAFANLGWKPGG